MGGCPTLLESKLYQSQERAIIILISDPQGLIHPDPGLQQTLDNCNENGRDEQSNTLTNISLNCVWKITQKLTQGQFLLTKAIGRLETLASFFYCCRNK